MSAPNEEPVVTGSNPYGPEAWTPHPDPTVLTTEQLHREINTLRAELDNARRSGHELIESQMTAMHELLDARMNARTTVTDEKLKRIDKQFDLVELQRVEQKSDTKAAVDAALTAQKEAVREQRIASETAIAKAEAAITKEMEQLRVTFSVTFEGIRRDIDINRERVSAIEQRIVAIEQMKLGGREAVSDKRASNAAIYALISAALAVLTIIGIIAALNF